MFIFRERGREEEREGEKHPRERDISISCLSHIPTGDLACNPGMCPDWELNQQPLSLQAGTQFTESHQPGLHWVLKNTIILYFKNNIMIMWKNVFTVLKTNNFSTLTYIPIQFLSPYIHVFYLWEASVFCFTCHNNARAYYSPLHIVVTRISVSGVNEWTSEMMNIQSILYSALLMSWIFYVTTNFKQIIFLCFVDFFLIIKSEIYET